MSGCVRALDHIIYSPRIIHRHHRGCIITDKLFNTYKLLGSVVRRREEQGRPSSDGSETARHRNRGTEEGVLGSKVGIFLFSEVSPNIEILDN